MKSILHTIILLFSLISFAETEIPGFLSRLEPLQNPQFVSTPDQGHESLIEAFNQAQKSIQVGIFGISDPKIADALSAALKRGVRVTVICDKYCTNNPKRAEIYNRLKAEGVEIYTASAGFSISHWKMFVIDEKKAFVSTMTFIIRTQQMRDVGVFLTNPSVISEILAVFKADIENAKNQTAVTPELSQPNLVWSPNNSEEKLSQLILSAQKSVEIWIENMGQQTIQAALKTVAARGVKVRLLTSECGMGMPSEMAFVNLKELKDANIDVHVMPFPATTDIPYIHAKTIGVDRKTQFLGSENFSTNSILNARELGIIFQNEAIEAQMNSLFEKDWNHSNPLPASPPVTCSPLLSLVNW